MLEQDLGALLRGGVHGLPCRGRQARARQNAPRLHQRAGPGGLQHVEGASPQPLRLPVPRSSLDSRPNPSGGCRAAEEGETQGCPADAGPDLPGPLFSLLAAPECVWLPEPRLSPGLHAEQQISAGPPLPPRQHLPAHRAAHVLPGQEAPADPHDEPGGAQPASAAAAGLGLWPLHRQLPRGAPPLPQALRPHVLEGEARGIPVPPGEAAALQRGHLPGSLPAVSQSLPGAHGADPSHHRAGGAAVRGGHSHPAPHRGPASALLLLLALPRGVWLGCWWWAWSTKALGGRGGRKPVLGSTGRVTCPACFSGV